MEYRPQAYEFIMENLEPLFSLNETTRLCLYRPKNRLYILKEVPLSAEESYRKLLSVRHPGLASVLYVRKTEDRIEVLRDYISGCPLTERLAGEVFTLEEAAGILCNICGALDRLHAAGLVHRDVTPNNIILTPQGNAFLSTTESPVPSARKNPVIPSSSVHPVTLPRSSSALPRAIRIPTSMRSAFCSMFC